jgi:internalin A
MKKFFAPALGSVLLYQGVSCRFTAAIAVPTPIVQKPVANQVTQRQDPKSFAQWCLERQTLPAATRHTVDALLKFFKTNSCQKADDRLRQATLLDLSNSQITDLQPLATMSKLNYLTLSNNQIRNLRPLAGLTNLITLRLDGNQISDLRPLAGLKNINALYLSHNQISDLRPLVGLSKIYHIQLRNNQISDLTPLASLRRLGYIDLEKNRISDVRPLLPGYLTRG